jgi:hypothetical protein
VGATNDRVLLRQGQQGPTPALAAVWQLRTNTLRATTVPAWVWSIGGTGTVLRRVDKLNAAKKVTGACLDAVDGTAGVIPLGLTGACSAEVANVRFGALSPDGRWAVLALAPEKSKAAPTMVLARTADLHAGRWQPVALGKGRFIQFWDTADTMIVTTVAGQNYSQQRCDTALRCTTLRLPAVEAGYGPMIIPRFGR